MNHPALAIIGGGNMAHAIYLGAAAAGVLDPARVCIAEPDVSKHAPFRNAVSTAAEAVAWLIRHEEQPGSGQVLLAVKPQTLAAVGQELAPLLASGNRIVLSILAGTPGAKVAAALGGGVRVIRIMPNTPARIGRGITSLALSEGAAPGDERFAESLFGAVGKTVRIDESLTDAFTALAGSGPAYVFYLAEAMLAAARDIGFEDAAADLIVRETIAGSALLLAQSPEPAQALRDAVTSRGGTTAAALDVLEQARVLDAWRAAITAARDRGRELARL